MDPWHLVASHRYAEALQALNTLIASNPGDPPALANRATVLLSLERFDEALADFRKADEMFSRRLGGGGGYRESIGATLWLLGRRSEALQEFQETIDGISKGSIRYGDNAGGVLAGLLLWYASITAASGSHAQNALNFLKGRAKKPRIQYWPGPLALVVLGLITFENALLSEFQSNNCGELVNRAKTDILLCRRLIQALFYNGTLRRSLGDEGGCRALMSACAGLDNPHIEDEWYLALAESRMPRSASHTVGS
jgi:tetratricopeptide (TPR) repeat protein